MGNTIFNLSFWLIAPALLSLLSWLFFFSWLWEVLFLQ